GAIHLHSREPHVEPRGSDVELAINRTSQRPGDGEEIVHLVSVQICANRFQLQVPDQVVHRDALVAVCAERHALDFDVRIEQHFPQLDGDAGLPGAAGVNALVNARCLADVSNIGEAGQHAGMYDDVRSDVIFAVAHRLPPAVPAEDAAAA